VIRIGVDVEELVACAPCQRVDHRRAASLAHVDDALQQRHLRMLALADLCS
jgi:hypothetical protein